MLKWLKIRCRHWSTGFQPLRRLFLALSSEDYFLQFDLRPRLWGVAHFLGVHGIFRSPFSQNGPIHFRFDIKKDELLKLSIKTFFARKMKSKYAKHIGKGQHFAMLLSCSSLELLADILWVYVESSE